MAEASCEKCVNFKPKEKPKEKHDFKFVVNRLTTFGDLISLMDGDKFIHYVGQVTDDDRVLIWNIADGDYQTWKPSE